MDTIEKEATMNRFWIILTIVIVGLVGLFIATKPDGGNDAEFTGDPKVVQEDDNTKGAEDGKVTLIEYGDFQCPSCAALYPVLAQVAEKYKDTVTIVYRHLPLTEIHPNAVAAARAAEAAGKQEKFWEMHDKLFETQNLWGQLQTNQQKTFESYAEELGLDVEKFKIDYASEEVGNKINRDKASAAEFNAQGTPTLILNGEKIDTPRDFEAFSNVIEEALRQQN